MMNPGEVYDRKGVPIYPGDVLRTFHYKSRRYGRYLWLFHVAVFNEKHGVMEMHPASWLDPKKKRDGGSCWLTQDTAAGTEIVQGYGPGRNDDFTDRKKKCQT